MHETCNKGVMAVAMLVGMVCGMLPIPERARAAGEGAVPVVVDRADCLRLVEPPGAVSAPGVSYTPGVDVHGRAVVPAEGPGGAGHDWLPDPVRIQLSVPLAKKLGLGDGATNYEADLPLGTLTIRDGRVYLNDRLIDGGALSALREACRRLDVLQDAAGKRKPTQSSR